MVCKLFHINRPAVKGVKIVGDVFNVKLVKLKCLKLATVESLIKLSDASVLAVRYLIFCFDEVSGQS